jgi:hypothetical protein
LSGYPPAGGPEPFAPAPKRRRGLLVPIIAVVVAIGVVGAVVYELSLRAHSGSAPNVVGTPIPSSQALGPGETAQSKYGGGPWSLYDAFGYGTSRSVLSTGGPATGCQTTWENTSVFTLPSTPSNATAGEVSGWFLVSGNSGGSILLTLVTDVGGTIQAANAVEVTGSCVATFVYFGKVPSGVVSSTVVATATGPIGGTNFLSAHSGASVLLILLGIYWEVEYTTCSLFAPSGSGENFTALFYATNGTQFGPPTDKTGSC